LKNKLIEEINLQKNVCFNNIFEKDNKLYIKKSNKTFSSSQEVSDICNLQAMLEKYKLYFDIKVNLEEIVIDFKNKRK